MVNNELTSNNPNITEILKKEYGMEIVPFKGEIESTKFSLLPVSTDLAANLSVITSSFPTLLANSAVNDAFSRTAYSITFNGKDVLPEHLYQKLNGSYISNLKGNGSNWGKQTDINVIDNTAAQSAMIASSVFAIASVATSMYYMKNINDKLSELQGLTKSILNFLESDKQSQIRADMDILIEISENTDGIKGNSSLKSIKESQLGEIQRSAKRNILFYEEQVADNLSKYKSANMKDKQHFENLKKSYLLLQFCLQEYAISKLVEISLTDNFVQTQLTKVRQEIENLVHNYQTLNKNMTTVISDHFIWKKPTNFIPAVTSATIGIIGEKIQSSPIGKTSIDENLIAFGDHGFRKVLDRDARHTAQVLNDKNGILLDPFLHKIRMIENVYTKPFEVIYDGEDAYLKVENE